MIYLNITVNQILIVSEAYSILIQSGECIGCLGYNLRSKSLKVLAAGKNKNCTHNTHGYGWHV